MHPSIGASSSARPRRRPALGAALLLAFLAIGWATTASAAALRGTLRGRVLDPQGRAVPGASVTLEGVAGSGARLATTDPTGSFAFVELPPGHYRLVATAAGFAPHRYEALDIAVGQTYRLDVVLGAVARSETVEASAEAPLLVRAGSSAVDGVIDTRAIQRLPLNGRNFLELAFLVPGNVPTPNFDPTKTNTVVVASAGQFGRGGMITIDGADNNDDVVGGPLQNIPEDAVQEFQIVTNRYTAETGRSAAAAINVVSRSGTDQLAGTVSAYFRDKSLQALPATYDRGQPAPPFSRGQYALSMGGPIRRGVAHWFGSLEYRDQDGAVLVGERDVAAQTIRKTFAPAPLRDWLGLGRVDWSPSDSDHLTLRYAFEHARDTDASTLDRSIGSASQRQTSTNGYHAVLGSWVKVLSNESLNTLSLSYSRFRNSIVPVAAGLPQLTFPSIQDGSSFRVPQGTEQDRYQVSDSLAVVRGSHSLKFGGEVQRVKGRFDLGVFQAGRLEMVQDFPDFDHNGDGVVNDDDLLFAVTLRSGFPDRDLVLDDCNNTYLAFFAQDDWRVTPELTVNLGLRWEMDTDVKNVSGYARTNPLVADFYEGDRSADKNNFGPRLGFNWASAGGRLSAHGGWGIYYDRITLEITSLERGLDGRALPIEVKAGNVFFLDPQTGQLPPFAPSLDDPFTGFVLPGAGASGISIIDNSMQSPEVQQWNLGAEARVARDFFLRVDGVYNRGSHFLIGRPVGEVFNPVVDGPDRVVNLESSVGMRYKALFVSVEKRAGRRRLMASYALSKADNYANDDQIPFSYGPIDPNDLQRELGPSPNDRRHHFTFAGMFDLPAGFRVSPLLTLSSGVPMDILMPDASTRVPTLSRNAGGRVFHTGAELNAYLSGLNAEGGIDGQLLPLVRDDAQFSDTFSSFDLRVSKVFALGGRRSLEAIAEVFNLFNVTNILGVSSRNYSGYSNVLARDSEDPTSPGYLTSSSFGQPVTTAGGVFGSGGPRAFQFGLRFSY
jgi:outer membrane receptor protein involved in Fe transport